MIFIKKGNLFKKIALCVLVCLILVFGGFFAWAKSTYKSFGPLDASDSVSVDRDEYIVYKPNNGIEPTKGLIFYPGAKVEPDAYGELCSKIAEQGYLVVIAPMTLNLAILSPNKAEDIINKYNTIQTWAIGGHSLGGVMAAKYALKDDRISGVVFYASYPTGDEMANSNLKVLSIYGSNDGVAKLDKVRNAAFPQDSSILEIEGGNHAGFGTYGFQKGDNQADITDEEQINQAARLTTDFLSDL